MPVTPDDLDGARTITQTAELFGYSYRHMQRVVASGAIDHIRLGDGAGRVLITQRAITDYLNRNARAAKRTALRAAKNHKGQAGDK